VGGRREWRAGARSEGFSSKPWLGSELAASAQARRSLSAELSSTNLHRNRAAPLCIAQRSKAAHRGGGENRKGLLCSLQNIVTGE